MKIIKNKKDWDYILLNLGRFDTYHTYDYHNAHSIIDGGQPILYVHESSDGIIAMPILERKFNQKYLDATSVYGYPGPITNINNLPKLHKAYKDLLNSIYLKNKYISLFSRTNCFTVPEDFLFNISSSLGETVTIDLDCSEEEQIKDYRANHKRDILKLKRKGFDCKFVDPSLHINTFIKIYEASMRILNATDYYFFPKSYFFDLFNNDLAEVKMVECLYDGNVTCCGIFLFCNDIVQYHLGGTSSEFYKFAPSKLMFDFVRKYSSDKKYKSFHLGGGLGGAADNLLNFKKGFSSKINKFYLIKEVLNEDIYNNLSKNINASNFFPLYRS